MSKVLTAVFFAVLSFDVVGALLCHFCKYVQPDNSCSHGYNTCDAGSRKYCYTQMASRGLTIVRVNRGCIAACRSMKWKGNEFEKHMLCCNTHLCNNDKLWK